MGSLKPKQLPDFISNHSTRHPISTLGTSSLPKDPLNFSKAITLVEWKEAMDAEYAALDTLS